MSKMVIPTGKFQDMVARASKGASENKLLPITSMMAIELKDNVLTLTTTDTANYLKVKADKVDAIVLDSLPAEEIVSQNPELKILEKELLTDKYGIAVQKGNTELLKAINEVLTEMMK